MKKCICFFATILMITLSACSIPHIGNEDDTSNNKTPGLLAKEKQTEVIECFVNEDKETLKALFSEYVISNDDNIDTEIEEAFNLIDSKIVSYDDPFGDATGSHEKKSYGGMTTGIITEQGTEYRIDFIGWVTYDADESKIGIEGIRIVNETKGAEYPADAPEEELTDCMKKIGYFE
jgi:hypothetical protein